MPRPAFALLLLAAFICGPAAAKKTIVTIGTGGVTGVYYPAGGAICLLVNRARREHGIRCTVESTDGSIFNLSALRSGELELAVVQSDWQYHAFKGSSTFQNQGPHTELRSLFSLHPEPFTVVARADSGIKTLDDLKGKRVNIGNPGSGQRATMEVVMQALGWTTADFAKAEELRSAEQAEALCTNKVDAIVFVVGHPSGSIKEATTSCKSSLVQVSGPHIDQLVSRFSYYRKAVIPGGMYRGSPRDVETFGVGATLVSTSDTNKAVIYQIVKSVFENFEKFTRLHPAFERLNKRNMVLDGLSAPLHDGAKQYFTEARLP